MNVWVRAGDHKKLGMITARNKNQRYQIFLPTANQQLFVEKKDILSVTKRTSIGIENFKNSLRKHRKLPDRKQLVPHHSKYGRDDRCDYIVITVQHNKINNRIMEFFKTHSNATYDLVTYFDRPALSKHMNDPDQIPNSKYTSENYYLRKLFLVMKKLNISLSTLPIIGKTAGKYVSYVGSLEKLVTSDVPHVISTPQKQKTVFLRFFRHGQSCTNVIKYYHSLYNFPKQIRRFWYSDPPITNFAKTDIESLQIPKPDLVFSSCLLRSIETALLLHSQPVVVVPFIKEIGSTIDNMPNTISVQKSILFGKYGDRSSTVDYRFVKDKKKEKFTKAAVTSSLPKFITWLGIHLDELLSIYRVSPSSTTVTISIVTHSKYMHKYLPSTKKDKPQNLGCNQVEATYDPVVHKLSMQYKPIKTYRPNPKKFHNFPPGKYPVPAFQDHKHTGLLFEGFPHPTKTNVIKHRGDANCKHPISKK